MIPTLKSIKEARYIVFIITIFVMTLVLCDAYVNSTFTVRNITQNLIIFTFPLFAVHTLYTVLAARRRRDLHVLDEVAVSANTFGLPDAVLVYAYVLFALIAMLVYVSGVDLSARDAAQERANRTVPDPHDSATWALSEAGKPARVQPLVSREQLLTGSMTVQSLMVTTSPEGYPVFGDVQFINGVAQSCVPSVNNKLSGVCDAFKPGMFIIRDAVGFSASTSPQITKNDTYVVSSGFVLMEYYHDDIADTLLSFVVDSPGGELSAYSSYPLPYTANASFVQSDTMWVVDEVRYDALTVATADGNRRLVHEIAYVRNGPTTEWFEIQDGMIEKAWPVRSYDEQGERMLGTQTYRFAPGSLSLMVNTLGNFAFNDEANGVKERVYFQDACESPDTYSDIGYRITDTDGYLGYVSVSFPTTDTYVLTTSRYGYEPSAWGTVVERRSVAAEHQAVMQGTSFNEHETELLTIAGNPVRHTLPYVAARPCETGGYQQLYQWVKDGNLYSLGTQSINSLQETIASQPRAEAVIAQFMAGFTYAPASE